MTFIVPDELMIPMGARLTKETGKCAINWSDEVIELYRAELPFQYHSVPVHALRMRWENIRKSGKVAGYKTNGHGPRKGSYKKPIPNWYSVYLASADWLERRVKWLNFWGGRCAICNTAELVLDVHHRTYERIGREELTDCIVLCRECHDLFHKRMEVPEHEPQSKMF